MYNYGINMNDRFIPLNCDDDVIFFEKDTFKVSKLKEMLSQEAKNKLSQAIYYEETKKFRCYVVGLLSSLSIGQESIGLNEIQFHSIKDCQILRVSGKGWQKGKLKIQISKLTNNQAGGVSLEFCSDEPDEPESPLDDIRKRLEANSN